eukprot:scaffold3410_cov141-Cylindrotheca_fusiformis.AAC.7
MQRFWSHCLFYIERSTRRHNQSSSSVSPVAELPRFEQFRVKYPLEEVRVARQRMGRGFVANAIGRRETWQQMDRQLIVDFSVGDFVDLEVDFDRFTRICSRARALELGENGENLEKKSSW